jgi:hypothetical protein
MNTGWLCPEVPNQGLPEQLNDLLSLADYVGVAALIEQNMERCETYACPRNIVFGERSVLHRAIQYP